MKKEMLCEQQLDSAQSRVNKCLSAVMMATAIYCIHRPPIATADGSFQQARQLKVCKASNMPIPQNETFTISFISCTADPFSICGEPIQGGCGPANCSITNSCQQTDATSMANAIITAINLSGCPGFSATLDSAIPNRFNVFFPNDICMCISDSVSGISLPLSGLCGSILVCDTTWVFSFTSVCPTPPQNHCLTHNAFGPNSLFIDFDNIMPGTVLSNEFIGLAFENAIVQSSSFSVSPPNKIAPVSPLIPIRITFDPPVIRAGCNIDSDGFTAERQPSIRAIGSGGCTEICDYGQGPDFKGIELPNCRRIVAIELGSTFIGTCTFRGSDGFDNLIIEPILCGDMNDDRITSTIDVQIFIDVLLGQNIDDCPIAAADVNMDGNVNGNDIQHYVNCVIQ